MKKITTVFSLLTAVILLLSLGYWQIQRLSWKNNIIAKLNTEYSKDPAQSFYQFKDFQKGQLLYGSVRGYFIYDKEVLIGPKPLNSDIGYLIVTPLKLPSKEYLLVNRGWINQSNKNQIHKTHRKGSITLNGVFRQPDWNKFTPNNSPENDIWTKLDIQEIAEVKQINPIAPLMLYAEAADKDFDLLTMQKTKWVPRNKHAQYALFWFTMAGSLLLISGLYWRKRRKT